MVTIAPVAAPAEIPTAARNRWAVFGVFAGLLVGALPLILSLPDRRGSW